MKKIDLHIHTAKSVSDYDFQFSLDKLIKYVKKNKIDCIAITNHNLFDKKQYDEICSALDIVVYPGVEVDLENGHMLVISPKENVNNFTDECYRLSDCIKTENDTLTLNEFRNIFSNTSDYLLIPHYKKNPTIRDSVINMFGDEIFAGEVKGIRDFKILLKDDSEKLVPVLFSDIRISDNCDINCIRQMYISTEELELNDIKFCLKDKNKVSLNIEGKQDFFQIFDDGLMAYNGLNVVLGERSSGKTVTMDRVFNNFKNVKYVKQFSLIEKDEKKEEKLFKDKIKINKSALSDDYLKEFKNVVDDILTIDLDDNNRRIDDYLSSLKKYVNEIDKRDSYSKAKMFTETEIEEIETKELTKVIDAIIVLLDSTKYMELIEKYIIPDHLVALLKELVTEYRRISKENKLIKYCNRTIKLMKENLNLKTSNTQPSDFDFKKDYIERAKICRFNKIVDDIKLGRTIANEELYGFTIIANTKQMDNAGEVGSVYGKKVSFKVPFEFYSNGFEYLKQLKLLNSVPQVDFYKLFISFDYRILNKYGLDVSGGERSEFNLLNELADAKNYDILLIDEPESSFDNPFLNSTVNSMLKKISQSMPVFVVTHNNSVGFSIKPDYILYTKRTINDGKPYFDIYAGYPTSKKLKTIDNKYIDTYRITIDSLEGGKEAYEERKRDYEILEN